MIGRHDEDERILEQDALDHFRRLDRQDDKRKIDLAAAQGLQLAVSRVLMKIEGRAGTAFLQFLEHGRQEPVGQIADIADPQASCPAAVDGARGGEGGRDPLDVHLDPREQLLAGPRQPHGTRVPLEECAADLRFKLLDLAAEGRLCDSEALGGTPEMEFLRQGEERVEMTKFHAFWASNHANLFLDGKAPQRYCDEVKLNNTRTLIIGGTSGIGLATARAVLDEGGDVVIAGRSEEKLQAAASELNGGARVTCFTVDVADEDSVQGLFAKTGLLDHIVVTAVTPAYQPIAEFTQQGMRNVVESKLLGALYVAKHGAPRLRDRGSITLTSGIAADRPAPRGSAIAAVNGAINSLAKALALELAPCRVNAISPGWIDTPVWDSLAGGNKGKVHEAMAARLPVRRIGRPEDAAAGILFLMTNSFTTGTALQVDGGHPLV